jgi:hypothetical protein
MNYWFKQTEEPLYPELEWNKPERRDQAGQILIIGGYLHNLGAPGQAYEYCKKQGVGDLRIALPSKLKGLVGSTLPNAIFLPSTASGELAHDGLEELILQANWANTLLLTGDLGRNSQTTLLVADLLSQTNLSAVLTKDAIDSLKNTPEIMFERENTTLILSFAQLQTLTKQIGWPKATTFSMGLVQLVELLHELTINYPVNLVTLHQNHFIVASKGQISTTKTDEDEEKQWRVKAASIAACYQTWNPTKPFESLTQSVFLSK